MSDFEVHPVGAMRLSPAAAAEFEREAAIDHVRRKIEAVKRKRHQLGGDLADHLVRCLDELAEDFDRGLHGGKTA